MFRVRSVNQWPNLRHLMKFDYYAVNVHDQVTIARGRERQSLVGNLGEFHRA